MTRRPFRPPWLLLMTAMLMMLGACGSPAPTTPSALSDATTAPAASEVAPVETAAPTAGDASGDTSGTTTIVHWQHHFEARAKIVQELATTFEAENPGIKIDFQSIPYNDYFQKIGPSLEAGTGPDVFQIPGPLVREFYDRGQLTPVPPNVYEGAQIEADFVPWTIQLLKQEGQYVGLPTDVQPLLLFYNDDLFKEAGLDPTKDFASLDELTAAAEKLTKRDGDTLTQVGADITASPYQWYWYMLTAGFQGGVVDETTLKVNYDSEQGVALWTWLTDLVTKSKIDSPEFLTGQDKFALGKAGMNMHEFAYVGNLANSAPDLNYSIHLPPPADGSTKGTAGSHWTYVVSKQSGNAEASWKWIKFLTSEEAQRTWSAGGGEMPSLKALYDDDALRGDPHTAAGLEAMEFVRPFDDFGWDDVYTIQQGVWDNVVLNGQDVATAVTEASAAQSKLYADKQIKPAP